MKKVVVIQRTLHLGLTICSVIFFWIVFYNISINPCVENPDVNRSPCTLRIDVYRFWLRWFVFMTVTFSLLPLFTWLKNRKTFELK